MENTIGYLSLRDAVKALQCSKMHVHNLVKRGKLQKYKLGEKIYFKIDEIQAAMEPIQEKSL